MSDRRRHGSGARDRRGYFQQLTESVGTSHRPVETWDTLPTIPAYAYRDDQGGRERFVADQVSAPYDTRWETHYQPEIDPDVIDVPKVRRWVYQGRVYEIVAANQIGRKDGIEFFTLSGGVVQ